MNNLLLGLDEKLNAIQGGNKIKDAENAVKICEEYFQKLRKLFDETSLKSSAEEIHFFKFIKPKFQSKLVFYLKWHKILIRELSTDNEAIIKYYRKECRKLKRFLKENIDFQIYLHSGQTHFDEKFFTRNNSDLAFFVEPLYIVLDHSFSTTHDYLTSQIMAYDMLIKKIQEEISKLSKKKKNTSINPYKWTDKKVDLVELIYAIHTSNSINRGNVEISEIAEIFSKVFDEDLGNIYRIYAEIKNRKNPTRYIDYLKEKLLEKIDDELGN